VSDTISKCHDSAGVYGVVITMYFFDHHPPHFRARYAEHNAVIGIADGSIIKGALPATALRLVREWAALRRDELERDWDRVLAGELPDPITPLP